MLAAFKEDWKRKQQQGKVSNFKVGSINRKRNLHVNRRSAGITECFDLMAKRKQRSKGSSSYDSNDRSYVKANLQCTSLMLMLMLINDDDEDEAYFHGLIRTIINKSITVTLSDAGQQDEHSHYWHIDPTSMDVCSQKAGQNLN
jgi:hypothetical protein